MQPEPAARLGILDACIAASSDVGRFAGVIADSPDVEGSVSALRVEYGFDELQAVATLDMQFRRISARERWKFSHERDEVARLLADLQQGTAE